MSKLGRSRAYPVLALQAVLDLFRRIVAALGESPYTRDDLIAFLGYKTSTSAGARILASFNHFGILGKTSQGYAPSKLAFQLLEESPGIEYREALQQAALQPTLFKEIVDELVDDGQIPENLPDLLASDFGINPAVKEEVSNIFMESAEFAGIVNAAGHFQIARGEKAGELVRSPKITAIEGKSRMLQSREAPEREGQWLCFDLRTGGQAELKLPSGLTKEDILILRKVVELLELQVELDSQISPLRWNKEQQKEAS